MKLTLVSPTPSDICAFGVRSLSAYMKSKGHTVKNIFLPTSLKGRQAGREFVFTYSENILNDLVSLAKDSDLIGVSFMTNYFDAAVQITEKIKRCLDIPIIWGGAHPTVKPEDCFNYVDMVCIGEGEEAMAELLQKMSDGKPYYDIQNLWIRDNGGVRRNGIRPLIRNLDSIPFYDFDLDGQYVIDVRKKKVVDMDIKLFKSILPREPHFNNTHHISFKTYTTRGCPHKCSYCIIDFIREMSPDQGYLRAKSVESVIAELELIKGKFPFIETIVFFDDTFIYRNTREIEAFSEAYKKRIGLPFHIQVSPTTISKQKMEHLIGAGLVFVEMGIQTGSEKTKQLYQRVTPNERVIQAANLIHSFQSKMLSPCYHVILDNPWEEAEDVLETLNLIMKLPKPYWLKRASLVFFPGTKLYERAKEEDLIKDEMREIYRKNLIVPSQSYVNLLVYLAGQDNFPRFILKILSRKRLVALLNKDAYRKIFNLFQNLFELSNLIIKGFKSLFNGDFSRISGYLKRRFKPVK